MTERIRIISFPRSGTHFLQKSITQNFGNNKKQVIIRGHDKLPPSSTDSKGYEKIKNDILLYMLRDPRDIIVSVFHWAPHKINQDDKNNFTSMSISKGLSNGLTINHKNFKMEKLIYSPMDYGLDHVQGLYSDAIDNIHLVKFHDLKLRPVETLQSIQKVIGRNSVGNFKPLSTLVGGKPYKGGINQGKEWFTEEDNRLFGEKCGETMESLGFDYYGNYD